MTSKLKVLKDAFTGSTVKGIKADMLKKIKPSMADKIKLHNAKQLQKKVRIGAGAGVVGTAAVGAGAYKGLKKEASNKFLEKIAVTYNVNVPEAAWSPFTHTDSLSLTPQEYKDFDRDTDANWTGKSMALHSLGGALGGTYLGAVGGGLLGAIASRNLDGLKYGAKVGAGVGAIVGVGNGLNRSHDVAKAEALRKHFPELDESWND